MRAFIAVELPAAARRTLEQGIAELRRLMPPARWVRAEGVHVTLKFLGEQPEELLRELSVAARSALGTLAPVTVSLAGAGFFPTPQRARVAWLGGTAPGLERWAAALEDRAAGLGIARESRPFSLHLTLARLERPWGAEAVERFLATVATWRIEPFAALEAVLLRSELLPSGAVYTPLERFEVRE